MATAVNQGSTGNQYIDGLFSGVRWSGNFTYSFPQSANQYPDGYTDEVDAFEQVSLQQREAVRAIMSGDTYYDDTTGVMLATSVSSARVD